MASFRLHTLSIREKLILLIVLVAGLAVFIVSTSLLLYERQRSQATIERDLTTQAELIAAFVASAISFDDPVAAQEALATLRARPRMLRAVLYKTNGAVFAHFDQPAAQLPPVPPLPRNSGTDFIDGGIQIHRPVRQGNDLIGMLSIRADFGEQRARFWDYTQIVLLLAAVGLVVAFITGARLQRHLTAPLFELLRTAEAVGRQDDPSRRAVKRRDDEVGRLVDGFNRMLDQLEQRGEALRASEERLSQALRGATDGLWDWNLDTNEAYYSPRWKSMLGYDENEIEPNLSAWERLMHPDDKAAALRAVDDCLQGRTPRFEAEFRMRHKDGHWRRILSRGAAIRDAQDKPLRMVGTHVDITERARIEAALRESEARLAEAQSIGRMGSYEMNPATGEILWSAELYRMRQRDPALGPPTLEEVLDAIHPDDRERVRQTIRRCMETGEDFREEYCGLLADGTPRYFLSTAKAVRDPATGAVHFTGTLQDITERRQAEEALRESEERFREMAVAIRQVFWLSDVARESVIYVSPAYERIWGRSCESLYRDPQSWFESVHVDDRPRVRRAASEKQARGEYDETYRITRPDGSERWIRDRAFPIRDGGGKVIRIAGVADDVTESKQLEQQVLEVTDREQARIGQDLHDGLCQHLVSTAFAASLLETQLRERGGDLEDETARAAELGRLIDEATTQAYHLVGGLFPASLAQEGLASALEELAQRCSRRSDIRFTVDYPDSVNVSEPEAAHLFRIAQEAVNNAIKHGRPQHVKLGLYENDDLVTMRVSNDGEAITAGKAEAGGFGIHFMRYRAGMIGALLEIKPGVAGGTVLTCSLRRPR